MSLFLVPPIGQQRSKVAGGRVLMRSGRAGGRGGADRFAVIVSTSQRVDAGGSPRQQQAQEVAQNGHC